MRKAVFLNLLSFEADEEILKSGLESLQRRGYSFISSEYINRLIAELPRLKASKLRWLEDQAIPALRRDLEELQNSPVQRSARASVPLPSIAWILDHEDGDEPEEIVSNLSLLQEEV
ncbi:MAG: hypothetical protein F6K16_10670 [Symploca sp. SIO2B6]|nr:hypothetical protein [Symploca sp. SIO2B6]